MGSMVPPPWTWAHLCDCLNQHSMGRSDIKLFLRLGHKNAMHFYPCTSFLTSCHATRKPKLAYMERSSIGVLANSPTKDPDKDCIYQTCEWKHLQMIQPPTCQLISSHWVFPTKAPDTVEQKQATSTMPCLNSWLTICEYKINKWSMLFMFRGGLLCINISWKIKIWIWPKISSNYLTWRTEERNWKKF